MRELVIYTDESDKRGEYYSNFYGGVLIKSFHLRHVIGQLESVMAEQNLHQEIKWTKVTANYLEKYKSVIDCFFDLVEQDMAKVRIMFTSNRFVPTNLNQEQRNRTYHLLYYQFLKHAFGLQFVDKELEVPVRVRMNIDQMPAEKEAIAQFKSYIHSLRKWSKLNGKIVIQYDQIAEVESHNHVILQCLDIILGSMSFRLNDKHKAKPKGAFRRGKKTIAKEKLYKHINQRIQLIYPNFNVGISTGTERLEDRWFHPYRHWQFIPSNHRFDENKMKP